LEVIDAVSAHGLNFVLLPWLTTDEDGEKNLSEIVSFLIRGCPATIGVYIPSQALPVAGVSGKILVPFFGGPNDIESILMGLNFSVTTPVVICRYMVSDISNSEETDFLSVEDKVLLDHVKSLALENNNIEYTKKKCKSSEQLLEALSNDLNQYSLVISGLNSLENFPDNISDRALAIGNVGAFIEQQKVVNLLIVNRSKRRPKYTFMPPNMRLIDGDDDEVDIQS